MESNAGNSFQISLIFMLDPVQPLEYETGLLRLITVQAAARWTITHSFDATLALNELQLRDKCDCSCLLEKKG